MHWRDHVIYRYCSWWMTLYRHFSDVIMSVMASQIIGVSIVSSIVCPGVDERRHQSSASLAFVRGIHRWPTDSPHKGLVTRKMSMTSSWTKMVSNTQKLIQMRLPIAYWSLFCQVDHARMPFLLILSRHYALTLYMLNSSEGTKTCIYILWHASTSSWHR